MTDTERLSPERLGKATASRIADVVAMTKSGWGESRYDYMADLVVERLSGRFEESYQSPDMLRGIELQSVYFEPVTDAGFIQHPTIPMAGATPDGLVGDKGLVEFKVPKTKTHIRTLRGEAIKGAYIKQCQWQLACSGREWVDWCSYAPSLPDLAIRLFRRRIFRDASMIMSLEHDVVVFLREVEKAVQDLRRLCAAAEAAE